MKVQKSPERRIKKHAFTNKVAPDDLMEKAFVSTYNKIGGVENHVKNFSRLYNHIGNGDGFLFFTDLHVVYQDGWEDRLKECMAYIEQLANTTAVSFVLKISVPKIPAGSTVYVYGSR